MVTKNEKKQTAAEVCRERMGDAATLLDQIDQELEGFRKEYAEDELSWPLAGDLQLLKRNLVEALISICPLSEEEVEETLAELRS